MRLLLAACFSVLAISTLTTQALADCSAKNTDNLGLTCSCSTGNCSMGSQCYCEDSSEGFSPVCECRSGRGGNLFQKYLIKPASLQLLNYTPVASARR